MNEKKECPDRIFLQACDKCYAEASSYADGVTWCEDEIGHECEEADEKDVEYVRLSRLKEAVKEIESGRWVDKSYDKVRHKTLQIIYKHIPELKED